MLGGGVDPTNDDLWLTFLTLLRSGQHETAAARRMSRSVELPTGGFNELIEEQVLWFNKFSYETTSLEHLREINLHLPSLKLT